MVAAQGGINKLRENVDTLLVIPNEKLLSISEKPLTLCDAFELADSVLKDTICGISNIVYNCGNINIDYNDVKTTLVFAGLFDSMHKSMSEGNTFVTSQYFG